jgi:integrase
MASLFKKPNGSRQIQFVDGSGKRRTIHLGQMQGKQAESILVRVEMLISAKAGNTAIDAITSGWVAGLSDTLHDRLVRVGLVSVRGERHVTISELFDRYFKTLTIKSSTEKNYKSARAYLEDHFGHDREIATITPTDAEGFKRAMRDSGLAQATYAKFIKVARQVFRRAEKWKLVDESPFAGISAGSQTNSARLRFVPRDQIERVLEECTSNEWRLLVALSRYGGLRCPSEHMALRWENIDWARNRMTVTASKTEAHANKESRLVPLFPEILPYLRQAFEEAEPGAEFVISDRRRRQGVNLGTQLKRFIVRAGLTPWPRVWHNLRASCQTELSARFPLHVVCSWLGNTTTVAAQHYLTVRESDFEAAVALQPVADPNTRLQNALQQAAEMPRMGSQTPQAKNDERPAVQAFTTECELVRTSGMPPEGLEPSTR